jgi:hypothetical protein
MSEVPEFPYFKPIELGDRYIFRDILKQYRPEASEWTFTNLFIWRSYYNYKWSMYKDWLLVVGRDDVNFTYALQPVGPPSREKIVLMLLEWLRGENHMLKPRIERADGRLAEELIGAKGIEITEAREHFDYIYLRKELANLAGNKYRSKRNHINQLLRKYQISYEALDEAHVLECIGIQEKWCRLRRCEEDLNLMGEWDAVRDVLAHYDILSLKGAVIKIEGKVTAFTVGEMLNDDISVVHIEKADPEVPGLYQIINKQFCEKSMQGAVYVNREQDLGLPGLRKAKMSYWPDHFVKKYSIMLKE